MKGFSVAQVKLAIGWETALRKWSESRRHACAPGGNWEGPSYADTKAVSSSRPLAIIDKRF